MKAEAWQAAVAPFVEYVKFQILTSPSLSSVFFAGNIDSVVDRLLPDPEVARMVDRSNLATSFNCWLDGSQMRPPSG